MNRSRGKILVIRGGAIGDFVLTLPALRALREQFPDTHLEVLGYPHIAQLALQSNLVDAVRSIEARALASFFARRGKLEPEMAAYFNDFPLIVSYLYDPDLIFHENVVSVTNAQFIVGPHRPVESEEVHATEVFLRPLEKLAIFGADVSPRLSLGTQAADTSATRTIALHPGSGSEQKNWVLQNWVSLIERLLTETNCNLLIVGGEADRQRLSDLAEYTSNERVKILEGASLFEVAGAIARASLFIGHDSGITHIAAAVGVPVLALWGPSKAAIWKPLGERVRLLHSPAGLKALTVEDVWRELTPLLAQ